MRIPATVCVVGIAVFSVLLSIHVEASVSCEEHPWPYQNALRSGEALARGGSLQAKEASLQFNAADGSITLVRLSDNAVLWNPGVTNAWTLNLTAAGNLVAANQSGTILWESGTTNATIFVVEDNCRATLYAQAPYTGKIWATNMPMCITAHITMHSHDDVGWLLTPEEYSDGCNAPGGGTNNIFTNMMSALANDPTRKFSEVEMYFFERWWAQQDESMRNLTRKLVANGQLEFINAGWSMHDEACVHQESAISNMEVGAQFLRDTFGDSMNITIGWHIDPFGHASTTPRIMAQMGFNAFFFWRQDYQQRQFMIDRKAVESIWHPSPSLGPSVAMFTSIMVDSYCMGCSNTNGWQMCPSGFYSFSCEAPTPWLDHDPTDVVGSYFRQFLQSPAKLRRPSNGEAWPDAAAIAASYVTYIREYADYFRTGHVLVPWGCDFQHQDAHVSFQLMDSVLAAVNGNSSYGMKMHYSHPSDYIRAVHGMNYSWPRIDDDYFLDSDNGHAYWSGYFSSRAEYKGYERFLMNERFAAEMALTSANLSDAQVAVEVNRVGLLRQALGVAQHHDSITGTERVNVREQYQFLLARAAAESDKALSDSLAASTGVAVENCRLANLSSCNATNALGAGSNVSAFIFNPLSRFRTEYITIPIPISTATVVIVGDGGNESVVVSEVAPTWELTTTEDLTSPSHDTQPYQLTFQVDLLPLGLVEVVIMPSYTSGYSFTVYPSYPSIGTPITIGNEHYALTFDANSHLVSSATPASGESVPFRENIMTYCPHPPYCLDPANCRSSQASGAYIFRTCDPNEQPVPYAAAATGTSVLSGPLCQEVRQFLSNSSNVHQAWRLCRGMEYVELTAGIGEIEMGPNGTEVILKVSTSVASSGVWYTDSEALEMQRRVRNQRPNYPYTVTEPVASNFFPCNAFAFVNSTSAPNSNLVVLADRSRATASLQDGELEFLVQRRLRYDDGRGVNQNLNESTRVLTTNRLIINSKRLTGDMRLQSLLMTHKPIVRFGTRSLMPAPYPSFIYPLYLPASVHLHTRSFLAPGVVLMRLQHLFAVGEGEGTGLDHPVEVDLLPLMPYMIMLDSIEEYDINGITPLAEITRLDFKTCDAASGNYTRLPAMKPSLIAGTTIAVLYPMDIRTFILRYHW